VNIIKLTHLDWYRFHGKQYVIKLLESEGFYDITIRRKMSLEDSTSFIVITGIYLSIQHGAVYGKINILSEGVVSDESESGDKMMEIITKHIKSAQGNNTNTIKNKPKYLNYKILK
jgi:hypothetical protein